MDHEQAGSETRRVWVVGLDPTTTTRISIALRPAWIVVPVDAHGVSPDSVNDRQSGPELLVVSAHTLHVISFDIVIPVLVVTSPDLVSAVSLARIDDILVAPWSADELRYRVSRLTLSTHIRVDDTVLEWAPFYLRVRSGIRTHELSLREKSYTLLSVLLGFEGRVVPRVVLGQIINSGSGRALDMQISRLRARLDHFSRVSGLSCVISSHVRGGYSISVAKKLQSSGAIPVDNS